MKFLTNVRRISVRLVYMFSILMFSSTVFAQVKPVDVVRPVFEAQGAFVAIVVTDLEASIRWYQDNLGMRLLRRLKSRRGDAENAALLGHNFFVELIYHYDSAKPAQSSDGRERTRLPGLTKAGVLVASKDFDPLIAHLQKQNVEFIGRIIEDSGMGLRTFLIRDNGGNIIQFFAPIKS